MSEQNTNGNLIIAFDNKVSKRLTEEIDNLKKDAKKLTIVDKSSSEYAGEFLQKVSKKLKEINTLKKDILEPVKSKTKLFEAAVKIFTDALEVIQGDIKKELKRYLDEQEEIRKKKEEQAKKELDKKESKLSSELNSKNPLISETAKIKMEAIKQDIENKVPDKVTNISTDSGTIKYKRLRKYELKDIKKVPIEFLQINPSAVQEALRAAEITGDGENDIEQKIPGIRFFVDKIISA